MAVTTRKRAQLTAPWAGREAGSVVLCDPSRHEALCAGKAAVAESLELADVPGLAEAAAAALDRAGVTLEAVGELTDDQLQEVPGVKRAAVRALRRRLKKLTGGSGDGGEDEGGDDGDA